LNFLIAHYLAQGPLRDAAQPLQQALEANAAVHFPQRVDWQGHRHPRTYSQLAQEHPHITSSELLRIMQAIVGRDASALLTAGGTILGRSGNSAGADSATACTSMAKKIRSRSRWPSQQTLSRSSRMPLSAVGTFRRLVRCHGHKYPTYCVLFDRTGRRMITGSDDFLIKIWCTRTGYLIKTFKGHQGMVSDIALNVENTLLASASTDGTVRIWHLKTGEPRAVLVANPQGRVKSITGVRFSPSPVPQIRFLAATCETGLCRLYRWHRDTLTFDTEPIVIDARSEPRDNISSFAFNHTGSRLAIATVKGYVSIYSTIADAVNSPDGASGWGEPRMIIRIAAHEESITTLVFSSDGEKFLTGSVDGTVKVWRCNGLDMKWSSVTVDVKESIPSPADAPEIIAESQDDFVRPSAPVAATSDSAVAAAMLAAAAQSAAVVASESAALATETLAELGSLVDSIGSFASELRGMQSSGSDDSVVTAMPLDADQRAVQETTNPAAGPVPVPVVTAEPVSDANAPIELVSDSTRAIAAPGSATQPAETQPQTEDGAAPVVGAARVETNQVAWLCDNTRIIASNNVGTVLVIDAQSGRVLWKRRSHSIAEVYVLIPHPTDPRMAVSGGYDGRAILWDTQTGDILHEYKVGEMLFDGSFSEDGLKFALTSDTGAALMFGLAPTWAYDDANRMHEQMFANDYTATIMDENHFVADQLSQIPSYLVPHSPLMDFDGRVYRRQRGTRFGLDIGIGVDQPLFRREDAGRMAALAIELDHADLDNRAAQAPIAEVQPSRGRRRQPRAPARAATMDELPEAELPLILPMDDDSDDEEYNAGEEEEEEEEDELEEDDEDTIGGFANAEGGRATRAAGDVDASAPGPSTRDRRMALQLLRSRHNSADSRSQRGSYRRSTRRTVGEDDDDDDDDADVNVETVSDTSSHAMDVDSSSDSQRRALRTSRRIRRARAGTYSVGETAWDVAHPADSAVRRSGRANGSHGADEPEANAESVTSDEEFRPTRHTANVASSARGGRRRGRPRINRDPVDSAETLYATRNRRIASDSESEDEAAADEPQEQSEESGYSDNGAARSHADADANIDIMPSSDVDSQSPYSSRSQTRTRGRATRANGTGARAHEDADSQSDTEAFVTTRAVPGRVEQRSAHMRVPRSVDMDDLYSDEPSASDSGRARYTNNNGAQQQQGRHQKRQRPANHDDASASTSAQAGSQYQPTDWILATAPSTVPYRPQIGDIIVYFREGHQDFWANTARCKKLSEKLLPYMAMPSLSLTVFGKVVDLRYSVGPPTFCTVKVQLLASQSFEELDQEAQAGAHELAHRFIQVQYHDCDGVPDFLILYSRYRASLHRPLKIGTSVEVLFDEDQVHQASIVGFRDIKPTSRQINFTRLIARNPWKSIIVEWADVESGAQDSDSRTEMVSPWELVHDDDAAEMEIPADINRALLRIVDELRDDPDFAWFIKNVDYVTDYPDYLLNIAYPICLDTIYERLEHRFYRHINAVSFDMDLIQQNADTFNDPGTIVPIAAQKMISRYTQMLHRLLNASADTDEGQTSNYSRRASGSQESPSSRVRASRRLTSSQRSGAIAAAAVAAMTIKNEGPSEPRRLRKRKATSLSATRSSRRASRRRLDIDSDGSDFDAQSEISHLDNNDDDDDQDEDEDEQQQEDDDEEEEEEYNDMDDGDDEDDALYA
ncbi:hypothetical protein GGF39_002897, partial [Coemansia sp. RSA 1721]